MPVNDPGQLLKECVSHYRCYEHFFIPAAFRSLLLSLLFSFYLVRMVLHDAADSDQLAFDVCEEQAYCTYSVTIL